MITGSGSEYTNNSSLEHGNRSRFRIWLQVQVKYIITSSSLEYDSKFRSRFSIWLQVQVQNMVTGPGSGHGYRLRLSIWYQVQVQYKVTSLGLYMIICSCFME